MTTIHNHLYKSVSVEFWIRDVLGNEKFDQFVTILKNDFEAFLSPLQQQ